MKRRDIIKLLVLTSVLLCSTQIHAQLGSPADSFLTMGY
jgi:hypothetical protein